MGAADRHYGLIVKAAFVRNDSQDKRDRDIGLILSFPICITY